MPDTLTDLTHRLMPLKGRCSNVITDYTRGYRRRGGEGGKGMLGVAKKRKIVTCEETPPLESISCRERERESTTFESSNAISLTIRAVAPVS